MHLSDAATLARSLMNQHGLGDWVFQFDRAVRRCGYCNYTRRLISLSRHYVERNSESLVHETVLHEIAHALVGFDAGHGPVWRAKAVEIGALPVACNARAAMPRGKLVATCPGCGSHHRRHKRPSRGRYSFCVSCGPDRGRLNWAKE